MRLNILFAMMVAVSISLNARNVTIHAVDRPAAEVFQDLMTQTGMNFGYPANLLDGITVTVSASNQSLKSVLKQMFGGTDIEFKISGDNVLLKRSTLAPVPAHPARSGIPYNRVDTAKQLDEVVVVSRLESPAVETSEIGASKLTAGEITSIPVIFGEPDVIKALQYRPGVSDGIESMAGMYVHGGNADQNLYMLDNVPLYQVNHFGGLFSAFNVDAIRYIDFFTSSVPARYDGRLSSFLDVRTSHGRPDGHHGSVKLGLTSGTFNIGGPIGSRTTYNVALRRSWFELLTLPMVAIMNSATEDHIRFRYDFMDFNANIRHRFSDSTTGFIGFYFGNDELHSGDNSDSDFGYAYCDNDKYDFNWGNIMAQAGVIQRFTSDLSAEFTAAFTRYYSGMSNAESCTIKSNGDTLYSEWSRIKTANSINDLIGRGDFTWRPSDNSTVRFGAGFTLHSFLPSGTRYEYSTGSLNVEARDSTWRYMAGEFNAYIEDDWRISDRIMANIGLHTSLFHIDGRTHGGLSPRLSVCYRPIDGWAVKGAYTRTVQYVHQLSQSYLALPSDRWIPITGTLRPQTADKVALGAYWMSANGEWSASVEGYYKWMHNLVDYRDEYYLRPPLEMWNAALTVGRGTARGIDFMLERTVGPVTGQLAYSLAWSDRTFPDKNQGKTFPARFDNRHAIKLLVNWRINRKVDINVAWVGHSGNRFTLQPQSWEAPDGDQVPLRTSVNNYQLPFYHRLDLSFTVRNSRGYWNFGLYNAYCRRNAVAINRGYKTVTKFSPGVVSVDRYPVFRKVSLLPVIPSVSYTWQF